MRHAGTPPRARRGFTLVELLVVVTILGLLAGIASLASTDDDSLAVELACRQITDALERAQAMAFSTRTGWGVSFDVADDCFAVVDEDGTLATHPLTKAPWEVAFVRPGQPKRIDIESVDFGDCGTAAIFDARGLPVSGGKIVVSRDGVSRTLTLDPATGHVALGE